MSEADVIAVTEANAALAVALLVRFFREEGFATPADRIAANLQHMLKHGTCWSALAMRNEGAVGVITVTTMLYVEWGRLGEIGDLNSPHGNNSNRLSSPTGFPALTVPMGFARGTLPAGLQMLGRPWSEPTLFKIAFAYEQATRHRRAPASTPPLP